ncbi:hypothetical protein NDU88_000274 [Pleurodeles waltl]|uniref:Uncharacterized protein n=1 Tax=Pleurodeles waltl TaxID=8319 RepID=A0AAV7UPI2_PLEWA|nr:hypothetical protein NDU88_000274 [Pleurodeles waltl]
MAAVATTMVPTMVSAVATVMAEEVVALVVSDDVIVLAVAVDYAVMVAVVHGVVKGVDFAVIAAMDAYVLPSGVAALVTNMILIVIPCITDYGVVTSDVATVVTAAVAGLGPIVVAHFVSYLVLVVAVAPAPVTTIAKTVVPGLLVAIDAYVKAVMATLGITVDAA